jgi:hypothetical protein
MGRPRKREKLRVISIRVEPELYQQLKRMKRYSSLVRKAIKETMKNYG